MREENARIKKRDARREKLIILYLGLLVLGLILFFAHMAGDAIIPIPPIELYMDNTGFVEDDIIDPAATDICGEDLCLSIDKQLSLRDNYMVFPLK